MIHRGKFFHLSLEPGLRDSFHAMKNKPGFFWFLLFFFGCGVLSAQRTTTKSWHFVAEPYLMMPNMKGETAVRRLPAVEVDARTADILGNLKFGAMFYFEASNDNWSLSSDLLYMDLEQEAESSEVISSGKVGAKEIAWELAGLKQVLPWLDLGLAGRIVSIEAKVDLVGAMENPRSGSISKTWFDPVIVARSNNLIGERWLLQVRGDLGGFGVGSDFTWQAQINAGYRFSSLFHATLGYRYIGIDYEKGEGEDRLLYDIDTYGAVVRLGFTF